MAENQPVELRSITVHYIDPNLQGDNEHLLYMSIPSSTKINEIKRQVSKIWSSLNTEDFELKYEDNILEDRNLTLDDYNINTGNHIYVNLSSNDTSNT
tara:strand:- start:453 stop:746 length:294 start_codon:yes stop_codon:yes gene_type:complete